MRSLILTLSLIACSGEPTDTATVDSWTAPDDPVGAWLAGTLEDEVVGRSGVNLPLQVWFPASSGDADVAEYGGFLPGGAVDDGVPACEEPRPAVVFSHGNGGIRYQSYFLTEHLARHGYVVIAPDHTGNTLADNSVDRGELALRRPEDVSDAFDWLAAAAADSASPLAGCIDPDEGFAIMGHSFGGYTTLAVAGAPLDLAALTSTCGTGDDFLCGAEVAWEAAHPGDSSGDLSDDRVWAAVPLAPAGALALVESGITVPTLAIGGFEDTLTTWEEQLQPIYAGLTTEQRALAGLVDVGHYTFTDFCASGFDGCGPESLDVPTAHGLIQTLSTAWLDVALGEARSADWLPPDSAYVTWEAP